MWSRAAAGSMAPSYGSRGAASPALPSPHHAPREPIVRISAKAETFTESVIREMTRLALERGAVNLAQGFPDFPCPTELKDAAKAAIDADVNQYAITWGAPDFRRAIADKVARTYPGWVV